MNLSFSGDFIKDEHDQWWFLQLKSFEVTEPCYRICRILSEAIQVMAESRAVQEFCMLTFGSCRSQAAEENLTPYEFRTTLRAMGCALHVFLFRPVRVPVNVIRCCVGRSER
jgi:hypothetical protein